MTRDDFTKWAQKNDWILITETASTDGRQYIYLTPSGNMPVILFDLKGNLSGVGQPMPQGPPILGLPGLQGRNQ